MAQRSAETRKKVVRAAYELFCERGFQASTMEAIADAAGLAVQTVYFQFRTKGDLLQAVHEWTVLGDEGQPPPKQAWHIAAMQEPDARLALSKIIAGVARLNARIAPMLPVFDMLATDPGGDVYRESRARRRIDMGELVTNLSAKTPLRPGMTPRRAADLLAFVMGPESYAELVGYAHWPRKQWIEWVSATLGEQLFGHQDE